MGRMRPQGGRSSVGHARVADKFFSGISMPPELPAAWGEITQAACSIGVGCSACRKSAARWA